MAEVEIGVVGEIVHAFACSFAVVHVVAPCHVGLLGSFLDHCCQRCKYGLRWWQLWMWVTFLDGMSASHRPHSEHDSQLAGPEPEVHALAWELAC